MTLEGRVSNGVVVLSHGSSLPDGTLVNITPVDEAVGASVPHRDRQGPPYSVSKEQIEALLGLIGVWKTDNAPSDEEVERIIEEYRMEKYG